MVLKFYNTLTKKLEVFKPLEDNTVKLYTCGPTVYNYPHIGNYRTYVFEDLLRRYLEYKGYNVVHVMNITDVDDKTIRDSQKEGKSLKEFTQKYEKAFVEDIRALNIEKASIMPRATDYVNKMVELIEKLAEKGYAYKSKDGSWYYSVSKFKDYGKLSGIKKENLKEGARVKQDEYEKEEVGDFVLWKAWDEKDGNVYWETPLGKGRPGWHIECSAMSTQCLGQHIDIHTGGVDNIFPHHENEIAQSEAVYGAPFVRYWLHSGHLLINGQKMSKSLGNFYTLRDILDMGYDPRAIRWLLLSTHYRQELNFTFEGLEAATKTVENIVEFMAKIRYVEKRGREGQASKEVEELSANFLREFEEAMDNDLAISEAEAAMFNYMNKVNKAIQKGELTRGDASVVEKTMMKVDRVLAIVGEEERVPEEIIELVEKRNKARESKDWEKADKLREEIKKKGYVVMDMGTDSIVIKKVKSPSS
ncbi:MAG: cysteine--tRNA ligase [Bdellovibrio sp.]|nr:MAG: cysteine--tRNA ligase [Bdellovibrio sp.]